jgi:hypothetical protein
VGQMVQVFGSVLILVSFGLAQLQKMSAQSVPYLSLNLAGSAILAASTAAGAQWGFLLLEGAWALVSMLGLAIAVRRRWRGQAACWPSPGRRGRRAGDSESQRESAASASPT